MYSEKRKGMTTMHQQTKISVKLLTMKLEVQERVSRVTEKAQNRIGLTSTCPLPAAACKTVDP
jgi:hypothetical protein